MQVHVKLPTVFVHDALASQSLRLLLLHSLTSEQLVPVPEKPDLQAHVKLPTVFEHDALESQLCVPAVHSLTSEQLVPVPE